MNQIYVYIYNIYMIYVSNFLGICRSLHKSGVWISARSKNRRLRSQVLSPELQSHKQNSEFSIKNKTLTSRSRDIEFSSQKDGVKKFTKPLG